MTLGELIEFLEKQDPALLLPEGFANPHSYRGYYDELAFAPAQNVHVGAMLDSARSALGATYHGWKGGEYTMQEYTSCWLAPEGCTGEGLGPQMLRLMIAAGQPEPQAAPVSPDLSCKRCDGENSPAPVIVVTDEHGRDHRYEDAAVDLKDGALIVARGPQDNVIAIYAQRRWDKACDEDAEVTGSYYRQGKKLAIALDALRAIEDEPHAGYGPDRARKAFDDIADVDL